MALKLHNFEHNLKRFGTLGYQVPLIQARNSKSVATSALPEECQNLENILTLAVGCRVMIRQNLSTEDGLLNGTSDIVRNILYMTDVASSHLEMLPVYVLVEFLRYRGPKLYDAVVPIASVLVCFQKMT